MPAQKKRLFYLDMIRVIALLCILIIHFNATVTGYFTLPSKLFPNTLPFGIYLGDFGSSLFFIVSGTALSYTTQRSFDTISFYRKRAVAVYPMFWLAWLAAFSFRFVRQPGYFSQAKTATLALTFLGLDNFAVASGWVAHDFALVGEWFLGSILFLYALFPALKAGLSKHPCLTWLLSVFVGLVLHLSGKDAGLLGIHIPEFLFGMSFVFWMPRFQKLTVPFGILLFIPALWYGNGKIICAVFSITAFAILALIGQKIHYIPLERVCSQIGRYSYAVFLLHHLLILRMSESFDLALLTRRDTALLFVAYLFLTAWTSVGLYHAERLVRSGFAFFKKDEKELSVDCIMKLDT